MLATSWLKKAFFTMNNIENTATSELSAQRRDLLKTGGRLALAGAMAGFPFAGAHGAVWTRVSGNVTGTQDETPTSVLGMLSGGDNYSVILRNTGVLWGVGNNSQGQLAQGSSTAALSDKLTPVPMTLGLPSNAIISEVQAAGFNILVRLKTGEVYACGDNRYGQLGLGTSDNDLFQFAKMLLISNATQIDAGDQHSVILAGGTVYTVGRNRRGQLGDGRSGDSNSRSSPYAVPGITNASFVAAGRHHTVIVRNGEVWVTGHNSVGQLGLRDTSNRSAFTKVDNLSNISMVACGDTHTLCLRADGTVWGFGEGSDGQLGNNMLSDRSSPVQMSGVGSNAAAVVAGVRHSLILMKDGTVRACGSNSFGQLGIDAPFDNSGRRSTPVQVLGMSNIVSIGSGDNHSFMMRVDKKLFSMGYNNDGQIGLGVVNSWGGIGVPVKMVGF